MNIDANANLQAEEQAPEVIEGDGNPNAGGTNTNQIDLEEAARIESERSERASRAALKSYFKQQGLSEKEVDEALANYREQRQQEAEAKKNDLTALQQKLSEYETQESETLKKANMRLVRADAKEQAVGMGFKPDRTDYAIRLADLSQIEVDDSGNPDSAAVHAALQKVAEDVPELLLKNEDEDKRTGFQLGGSGQSKGGTDSALAAIFGNTK